MITQLIVQDGQTILVLDSAVNYIKTSEEEIEAEQKEHKEKHGLNE